MSRRGIGRCASQSVFNKGRYASRDECPLRWAEEKTTYFRKRNMYFAKGNI